MFRFQLNSRKSLPKEGGVANGRVLSVGGDHSAAAVVLSAALARLPAGSV